MIGGQAGAEEIRIGGTGAGLGTMRLLADAYTARHDNVRMVVLPSIGSGGGINAVLRGAIQIAVTSRSLDDTEHEKGASQIEYGRTPFVFAISAHQGKRSITTQELADIYAGSNELWPDGSRMRLVLRPVGDADSEMVRNMSPVMHAAEEASQHRKGLSFALTDQEAADSLEQIPGAIGPSSLALILSEKRALQALALDGIMPTAASIADGSYRLFKTLYIVLGPTPSPAALDFVEFVRTPAARQILLDSGHWVQ
jgi:phosphate transport system substrate-binding protein